MAYSAAPVLLGADMNCYSLARSFWQAARLRCYAYGQMPLGATKHSGYVHFTAVPGLCERENMLACLFRHAEEHQGEGKPFLLPCTDEYARMLIEEEAALSPYFILPQPPKALLPLFDKMNFYRACEEHGIPYPKTVSLDALPTFDDIVALGQNMTYPYIIKPSSSVEYWHHPFPHMEKVYLAHNAHEAASVLESIFSSGYRGQVLLQKYMAGGDRAGYVLSAYFDRQGEVKLLACGHVLLEEHTPKGKGNYAALVTASPPPLAAQLCAMLKAYGYRGFANFDLRKDEKSGRFYVLELNLRLGRSHYLLTGGGMNPASLLLADCIYKKPLKARQMRSLLLYRTVPFSVVWHYTANEKDACLARTLHHTGRECCPYHDRKDLLLHPLRAAYVALYMRRQKQKFRRYCIAKR